MTHEFAAIVGPDSVARVLYVPEGAPYAGVLLRSIWSHECEAAADTYNREREEREAAIAAGQQELDLE